MHKKAVNEIVKICRFRSVKGDCLSYPPFPNETLENCVLELAQMNND